MSEFKDPRQPHHDRMTGYRTHLDALGFAVFRFYNNDTKPDSPGPGEGDIYLTVAPKHLHSSDVDFGQVVKGRRVTVDKIDAKIHWVSPEPYRAPRRADVAYYTRLQAHHDEAQEEAFKQVLAKLEERR